MGAGLYNLVRWVMRAPIAVRYEQFPRPRQCHAGRPTGGTEGPDGERKEGSQWQQEP